MVLVQVKTVFPLFLLPKWDDPVPLASSKNHVALVGFTDQVAYYMRLCDALVGKPGPGVVSEALVSGLPVIVELNEEHTPPQEQAVAHWISDHHVGVVIDEYRAFVLIIWRRNQTLLY